MAENRGEDACRSMFDDDDTCRTVLDDDDTMMLPPDRSNTCFSPMADDRGEDACRSGLGVGLDCFCFFWVLNDNDGAVVLQIVEISFFDTTPG
jgi:hypothetical protein